MNGQVVRFALAECRPISVASWLPASYRAYAVQEDYRYVPGQARAQMHFIETSQEIARAQPETGSLAIAAILALLLGPIGMLYGSEIGALVMAMVECVSVVLKQVPDLLIAWMIGVVWSVLAVTLRNRRIEELE
jgi:hypothetical protein